MRIRINNTWLAPGGREGVAGLAVNGQQLVEEVQFFRALRREVWSRGGRQLSLSFTVEREHGTVREAERFLLTHYDSVPLEGDVVFTLGVGDDTEEIALLGAVVEAVPDLTYRGVSSRISYQIRGGTISTDSIPDSGEIEDDVTRRGTVAIAEDATEVEVTFLNPMSGTPTVVASIVSPEGSEVITCMVEDGSISASGFTAQLSFPAPAATYKLSYIAIL